MSLYQILCLVGIPSLCTSLTAFLIAKVKKTQSDTEAVKLGIQALLRSQMISDFNKWSEKGYAPIYARENFENVWRQYHNLGVNGVMDDLHEKFLDLPTKVPEEVD